VRRIQVSMTWHCVCFLNDRQSWGHFGAASTILRGSGARTAFSSLCLPLSCFCATMIDCVVQYPPLYCFLKSNEGITQLAVKMTSVGVLGFRLFAGGGRPDPTSPKLSVRATTVAWRSHCRYSDDSLHTRLRVYRNLSTDRAGAGKIRAGATRVLDGVCHAIRRRPKARGEKLAANHGWGRVGKVRTIRHCCYYTRNPLCVCCACLWIASSSDYVPWRLPMCLREPRLIR
jgi:hypothetical protein